MRVPSVMGVGNPLLGDEGVGVRASEMVRLRAPRGIRVLEVGPLGLDALPDVEGASRLLILDCIDAGLPAGTLLRLEPSQVPDRRSPELSPHELTVGDLLALAALQGREPDVVVVMGIQPARIAPGTDLSPEVSAALPRFVEEVLAELARWGSAAA